MSTALLVAAVLAPAAQARVERLESLASSPAMLTAVAADPTTGLLYAQENEGPDYFVYNPRTNVWTELAPAPLNSQNNGGAAYLNGKIYVSYVEDSTEMAVYDIASGTWATLNNPLGVGTADITAANGRLYMAMGKEFVSYEPATGITSLLAEPPDFPEGGWPKGFEPWGGLQYDGSGKIYGHEGDGHSGFGVYDIATNSWTELPAIPEVSVKAEGAVAGSAFDPVTDAYLTYGGYGQKSLYRFDVESGGWTTTTLSFVDLGDGGMAYVPGAGIEGVYMVEGEYGAAFARHTEANETDLSTSMSASVTTTSTGGEIVYSIQVKNNGPERAGGVVLSDSLPAGTTLVSAAASQGSCAGTSSLSCSVGVLLKGGSVELTVKVKAGPGTVTNTAKISSLAVDADPANDSATVVSTVPGPAVVTPIAAATPVRCVVPKLRGKKLRAARRALGKAHCKAGKVTHRGNGKVRKGRIVRASKRAGKSLPAGAEVNLTVSSGPKKQRAKHER